jgi:cysteine desulfurase
MIDCKEYKSATFVFMNRVYFDNAATTPIDKNVLDEMLPFLTEHFGNPSSIHHFGRKPKAAVEKARKQIANFLNASAGEIFFTSGGTESNNMVLRCAVRDLGVQRIITSPIEHDCVLNASKQLQKEGIELDLLNVDSKGNLNLQQLETLLENNSKKTLVSLMHANNEIGTITDIHTISQLCIKHKAFFHTDTVQSLAYFPFDVQQIKVDFLSGSAHKLHGPKGVGFVYINNETPISPLLFGGSQERNMRAGTENVACIVGFGKAIELAQSSMRETETHIRNLKSRMVSKLVQLIPDIQFNGDIDNGFYKILSVSLPPNPKSEMMLMNIDIAGIAASAGSACSSGTEKGSHVLEAINAPIDRKVIRFSFSKYNSIEEVDYVVNKLEELVGIQASNTTSKQDSLSQ